ncbi:MAG: GDP-mannose 4,6-dehydratase [Calditrichaeota bacterium]|nr:GDP-mannose 4,6-dehydratase [Calditrichota bacterium]
MNILVTGGAGFIGSHVVEMLLGRKHKVAVIDNLDPFYDPDIKEKNLKRAFEFNDFSFYKQDILNQDELSEIFSRHDFELIIHLAAKAGVRPSIEDPRGYYKTNVEGTLNLLEECRARGIQKFIFASSSSVYGNNKKVPFSEDDNVDYPISPYAATKKAGELLCHNYHHLYGMDIFCLRFFTVYGPRQRPDLAIHKFFDLVTRGQAIPVFGDGSTQRDYTYIDDILDGISKSIDKVAGYEIINLGESRTISLKDLIAAIEKVSGKKIEKKFLEMQPGDVLQTYADITKARNLLGYDPKTDLETGLRKFYEWFLSDG